MKGKLTPIVMVTVVLVLLVTACGQAPTSAPPEEAAPEEAPPEEAAPEEAAPEEAAPEETAPEEEEKVLKIGVQAPFTGPNARVGEEYKGHVTMAFDAIDWKVGPYKIEPVWIDTESDPEKGVRAYKEAVLREKIQAGLTAYHSSVTVAIMDVAAQYRIPHFFNQNESHVIVEKYLSDPETYATHSWKGKPSPPRLFVGFEEALFRDAIEQGLWEPKNQKFAAICEDTDYGRDTCASFIEIAEGHGWEAVGEDYTPIDETEYYPLLTKLMAEDPSLLFISISIPAPVTSCIKQIQEVGLESLTIAFGLGWTGEWYELTGEAGDYIIDLMPTYATAEQKAWAEEFEERFGLKPGPGIAVGYDYANFFIKILEGTYEKYGELNSETILKFAREEVSTGQLTYTDGLFHKELKWTPETTPEMVVGEDYYLDPVIQYFGGEAVAIWPDAMKEADLQVR
jgi:branched-chain amino acid transport system substrate-binding protein